MTFVKMAFQNVKRKIHDYLIYLLTLTALSAMMLSAFMLPVFPILSDNDSGTFMSNSLPAIIALALLFLMLYMNRFMLKRRSQEYAIYMLSGVQGNKIGLLFFGEHLLLGLFALMIGLLVGLLLFVLILTLFSAAWTFGELFFAVIQTCLYFLAAHIFSLISTVFFIRRLNIKKLLYHRKASEQNRTGTVRLICLSVITITAFIVYYYQIQQFNPLAASALVLTVGILVYGFYASILGWLSWYRRRRGSLLYHDMRLIIIGQLISKIKTTTRMSAVTSGCLLCAMVSFVAGWVFAGGSGVILGEQDDVVMGFAQFYIAILFTVIAFSMIALQQIVDLREHKQQFIVLRQLGADTDSLNRTLLGQVCLNFITPVLLAVILLLYSLYPLEQALSRVLDNQHLLIYGAFTYMGIFIILHLCYMAATYVSIKKIL